MTSKHPPTGTVTLLFTDIEGSTQLWERDAEGMERALADHDEILRSVIDERDGHVFKTVGDAFCAVFARPGDALQAAIDGQRKLVANGERGLRVRMALHTGQPESRDDDYFGRDVNRVARLLSIGHGGQVLVSGASRELLDDRVLGDATLRSLGAHTLKDVDHAEHVFQLVHPELPTDFPPLRSPSRKRHNLPERLTSFIGRDEAMAKVGELMEGHRIVTLTGHGGTGKTRLATQYGLGAVDRFEDGVWLVELGDESDPERVLQRVATAVGVREAIGRPLLVAVTDHLRDRKLLLILDNCEHLAEACGRLTATLLAKASGLRILATSREPLGIEGEQVWAVPLLDETDSVRLYADRARLAREDFVVDENNAVAVTRLCRRLEGIPLAIELAAARVALLSTEEIAARLVDRFDLLRAQSAEEGARHGTLEATIDWSYELLEPDEQALFERLSVFAGGWSLEAAEAIAPDTVNVLDELQGLVAQSLVIVDRTDGWSRYRMLDTTREYAARRLQEHAEGDAIRDRHADWYAAFTEHAEDGLSGQESAAWMAKLAAESGNLRDALAWGRQRDGGGAAIKMVGTLWRYWLRAGAFEEGIGWTESTIYEAKGGTPRDRGKALYGLSTLLFFHGEVARSRAVAIQALGLGTEHDDPLVKTRAHAALGRINLTEGALEESIERHQMALEIAREVDEEWAHTAVSLLLGNLAEAYRARGDLKRARELYREALTLCRQRGYVTTEDMHHFNLGQTELLLGNVDVARKEYRAALSLAIELGKRLTPMYGLLGLAQVAVAEGDAARAACLFGAADALRESMGAVLEDVDRDLYEESVRAARKALGQEAFRAAWDEGLATDLDAAAEIALDTAPAAAQPESA